MTLVGPAPAPAYVYHAICARVIDGDTFVAQVDLGFGASIQIPVRLHAVNAPEHNTPEGKAATEYLRSLLEPLVPNTLATPLLLASYKDARSFARWVCDVWAQRASAWLSIADLLVDNGHAVPFDPRVDHWTRNPTPATTSREE